MKIDADEKELLDSVERGEWKPAAGGKRERTRYTRYAKATFRKDRRLNIRLSSKDLEAIQKRVLAEGLPYQMLTGGQRQGYRSALYQSHASFEILRAPPPLRFEQAVIPGVPGKKPAVGEIALFAADDKVRREMARRDWPRIASKYIPFEPVDTAPGIRERSP